MSVSVSRSRHSPCAVCLLDTRVKQRVEGSSSASRSNGAARGPKKRQIRTDAIGDRRTLPVHCFEVIFRLALFEKSAQTLHGIFTKKD